MKKLIEEVLTNKESREAEALEKIMLAESGENDPWMAA